MHELVPLFGVMLVTVTVMGGLLIIFRRWMARRTRLLDQAMPAGKDEGRPGANTIRRVA